jgi:holo-[acyl-carrier protein] synthase
MILGVGIDIVRVDRIRRWEEVPGLVGRYFHPEELADSRARGAGGRSLSLAARFAAKEAFGKALGTGLAGIRLGDIQVANDANGRPDIVLHGTALARLRESGGSRVHLSLTHDSENAVAVAIIEG